MHPLLTYTPKELADARRWGNVADPESSGGIAFKDWLEGSAGAGFALFREPHHTDDDIVRAKRWLVRNRDVVVMYVYRPEKG
jgi:hypothetical protein